MELVSICDFIITNNRGLWLVTDIFEDTCRTFVTLF